MTTETRDDLFIAASASSPEVDFRFGAHALSLRGESYPENAAAFYGDLVAHTRAYLGGLEPGRTVVVDVALTYFNSSSTKMLFAWFGALNEAAENGVRVVLNWRHDADDDTIQEFGAELHEEFAALEFNDVPLAD
ncbi:MAG TPA: DUF1987 domain-containing protein [Dokdonella sp.]